MPQNFASAKIHFDVFEIDLKEGELRKAGLPAKLAPQPFRILAMLARRPGETVTREEIQRTVWGDDTFVDFGVGLNQCIRQIRSALDDDAQSPRFIETMPRRGYRFIGELNQIQAPVEPGVTEVPAAQAKATEALPTPGADRAPQAGLRVWIAGRMGAAKLVTAAVLLSVLSVFLAARFLAGRRSPSGKPDRTDTVRSLAVLPFRNLSGDAGQDYIAEGITDQLITKLAQISALRVTSGTSVVPYRDTQKPLAVIARELKVSAIVEGTVVRSGNRLRITAQLVQTKSERHLWAKSFERTAGDALDLENEIAEQIASEISVKLTPEERAQLDFRRTESPAAEDAYLRGEYELQQADVKWNSAAEAPLMESIRYFKLANLLDPDLAAAYAGKATAYDSLLFMDVRSTKLQSADISANIKAAALRALQIDPQNARAHLALALDHFVSDWDWAGADAEFRRALSSAPSFSGAHIGYASYLCAVGRTNSAISHMRLAEKIDPVAAGTRLGCGWVLYNARRYEEAARENRAAVTLDPNSPRTHDALGWTLVKLGRWREAKEEFRAAAKLSADAQTLDAYTAYLEAASGKRKEALATLQALDGHTEPHSVLPYVKAEIYAALGDHNSAFASLDRACKERSFEIVYLRVDPDLDPLRSDPRFAELLRRMNLPR